MRLRSWLLVGFSIAILVPLAALLIVGVLEPARWYQGVYAGGFVSSTEVISPPFPPLTEVRVFGLNGGAPESAHLYLLGSDAGGRDMLALTAHAVAPSLFLVALVVLARLLIGTLAGTGIAAGWSPVRILTMAMGRWISGFPYLMLAIIFIRGFTPYSRWFAFVLGMAAVGWRDVAVTVADQIEYVRSQPFALSAKSLGTRGWMFFRLHVWPFLRPALSVEVPFQAAAVLVLLAELGYLQVFLAGATVISEGAGNALIPTYTLANQPELGQLLSTARVYIQREQFAPVLVPAVAVTAAVLAFELLGNALRVRQAARIRLPQ